MKIGVIGALEPEIKVLLSEMGHPEVQKHGIVEYYTGHIADAEIMLVRSGVGKVAAAIATTILIQNFAPDYVVNTGSAGGLDTTLNVGDIVFADEVYHHDVDVTQFGFELGQVYQMPATYSCAPELITAAETAARSLSCRSVRGQIATGDAFMGTDESVAKLRELFPQTTAVEMEGAAIGQTCYSLNTPFIIIRSLSDIAGKESHETFLTYLEKAGKQSAQLVMGMITQLMH